MEIEPLQKPHPPLWYGAHSPDSAERAARKGLHIVNNDMPAVTRAIVARYRAGLARGARRLRALPKMGMVRFIVVADTRRRGAGDRAARLSALALELHAICTRCTAPSRTRRCAPTASTR